MRDQLGEYANVVGGASAGGLAAGTGFTPWSLEVDAYGQDEKGGSSKAEPHLYQFQARERFNTRLLENDSAVRKITVENFSQHEFLHFCKYYRRQGIIDPSFPREQVEHMYMLSGNGNGSEARKTLCTLY